MRKMAPTTMGQKVWSGVCWNAMYDGASMSPPKSGWNFSASGKPTAASMATRECLISASWTYLTRPGNFCCEKGLPKE